MGQSNSAELLKATEAQRRALLAEIGHRRASAVITYFTTTRPGLDGWESSVHADDIQIVERHVKEARRKGVRNIDLLLCTYGGRATVPWGLVAMIREHLDDGAFRVIAPGEAYSAGACICLGADEVVMGRESVLGPVDSQFPWPRGGYVMTVSASDLQGFMDFLHDQDLPKQAAKGALVGGLAAVDPIAAGALYRRWRENRRQVDKLLSRRRPALSKAQNDRVMRFMLYDIADHGQPIRRSEARENGLSFITDLEQSGVEEPVRALSSTYAEIMRIRTPFARPSKFKTDNGEVGDEMDYDATGAHVSETPVVIVESTFDTNAAFVAYGLRHWDDTPPIVPPPEKPKAPVPRRSRAFWTSSFQGA